VYAADSHRSAYTQIALGSASV